jgi:hypothetical protein
LSGGSTITAGPRPLNWTAGFRHRDHVAADTLEARGGRAAGPQVGSHRKAYADDAKLIGLLDLGRQGADIALDHAPAGQVYLHGRSPPDPREVGLRDFSGEFDEAVACDPEQRLGAAAGDCARRNAARDDGAADRRTQHQAGAAGQEIVELGTCRRGAGLRLARGEAPLVDAFLCDHSGLVEPADPRGFAAGASCYRLRLRQLSA